MHSSSSPRLPQPLPFLADCLFFLAAWTLVIKFVFPMLFALAGSEPLMRYVMWDFWWVVHIALGLSILSWGEYTLRFAVIVSVVEIVIIVTKFALFALEPLWTFWRVNWFINKVFVLICFVLLLYALYRLRDQIREGFDEK